MEFIRGIHNLRPRHRGCALTIGNFDGFHRGHQALIEQLHNKKRDKDIPLIAMIFEPQPQEFFFGRAAPARLTRVRDKVKYLTSAGVDVVVCVTFNKRFAVLNANDFVTNLLIQKMGVRFISVGNDFRFGYQREGNFSYLQKVGRVSGFEVRSILISTAGGRRISSTAVRNALSQDRLLEAEMLLGHPYRLSGRVVYGNALGRTIGFPTANISLQGRKAPINGVYAVEVHGITNKPMPGIANIGIRPTINGKIQLLEVHILDLSKTLYGYHIEVIIRAKVRNEKKFNSLYALRKQIEDDVEIARHYFSVATLK